MKRAMLLLVVMSGVLFFVTPPVQAIPITVEFTYTNFISNITYGTNPAPTNPVHGIIRYESAPTDPLHIESLTSIDLTIDGHTYGLSEVGFESHYGGYTWVGAVGNANDVINVFVPGTNDFRINWGQYSYPNLNPYGLIYTSANTYGLWVSYSPSTFTVTPIPSAMLLLGSGLAGLVGIGMWRMKKLPLNRCREEEGGKNEKSY